MAASAATPGRRHPDGAARAAARPPRRRRLPSMPPPPPPPSMRHHHTPAAAFPGRRRHPPHRRRHRPGPPPAPPPRASTGGFSNSATRPPRRRRRRPRWRCWRAVDEVEEDEGARPAPLVVARPRPFKLDALDNGTKKARRLASPPGSAGSGAALRRGPAHGRARGREGRPRRARRRRGDDDDGATAPSRSPAAAAMDVEAARRGQRPTRRGQVEVVATSARARSQGAVDRGLKGSRGGCSRRSAAAYTAGSLCASWRAASPARPPRGLRASCRIRCERCRGSVNVNTPRPAPSRNVPPRRCREGCLHCGCSRGITLARPSTAAQTKQAWARAPPATQKSCGAARALRCCRVRPRPARRQSFRGGWPSGLPPTSPADWTGEARPPGGRTLTRPNAPRLRTRTAEASTNPSRRETGGAGAFLLTTNRRQLAAAAPLTGSARGTPPRRHAGTATPSRGLREGARGYSCTRRPSTGPRGGSALYAPAPIAARRKLATSVYG